MHKLDTSFTQQLIRLLVLAVSQSIPCQDPVSDRMQADIRTMGQRSMQDGVEVVDAR